MRMAVAAGRLTVGGPPGVGNTHVRIEDLGHVWLLLCDELLELCNLAHLFEGKDLIFLVAIDRKAGGIVATVLQTSQTYVDVRKRYRIADKQA